MHIHSHLARRFSGIAQTLLQVELYAGLQFGRQIFHGLGAERGTKVDAVGDLDAVDGQGVASEFLGRWGRVVEAHVRQHIAAAA